jgi:hypothetical protein
MATFVISNLDTQNFAFKKIEFKKLTFANQIEAQWRDNHGATFKAEADDNLEDEVEPIVQNNGLIGVVDDTCLLLSLAQTRTIYCREYYIKGRGRLRNNLPVFRNTGTKLVDDKKIEPFLNSAVKKLREPGFAQNSGFIRAAYYLLMGDSDEIGEASFMLTWIALEILANAHAENEGTSAILLDGEFKERVKKGVIEALNQLEKKGHLTIEQKKLMINKIPELNRPSIRNKVHRLRDDRRWGFITNSLLNEYINVRDHIMHLGTHGRFTLVRVIDLTIKLRMSMYLALIDLIGCSEYISYLDSLKKQIEGN